MGLHLVCAALAATDVVARALRLSALLRAFGHDLPVSRLVAITLTCDAACAVTPLRAGGEPARVTGMMRSGVPARHAVLAVASESILTWPVILGVGAALALAYGRSWWTGFARHLARLAGGVDRTVWLAALPVVLLTAWLGLRLVRRLRRRGPARRAQGGPRSARPSWRMLLATTPLTLIAVSSRVLILPVLASALTGMPFGGALLGSFVLLHGQLFLPTPAGAGAVDVGVLAQAGGSVHAATLLVLWRLYTSGFGAVLGLGAAAVLYGPALARTSRKGATILGYGTSRKQTSETPDANAAPP
jgi:hypothetical protein